MRRLLIAMTILLSACNLVADPTADEICPSRAVDFDAAEEISLDGLKGLQWTPRGIPVGTILYFPGGGFNSVSRFDIPSQVVRLVDVGWVVRSVEYTTGDPDQAFDDAWHWATQRHAAPTVAVGHSAGGTIAQDLGVDGLYVQAWTSVSAPVDSNSLGHYGGLWEYWAKEIPDFDPPHARADHLSAPGYMVHGDHDLIVHEGQPAFMLGAYETAGAGSSISYDYVNTGPETCRGHLPWCGMNMESWETWLEGIR